MNRLLRVASHPGLYLGWAAIVVVALGSTYSVDPYVFGFTALGMMWIGFVLVPCGLITVFVGAGRSLWARSAILASVTVAVFSIVVALQALSGFNWP